MPEKQQMIAEVIGSPISHSKSPLIHNQWISALGLNACFAAVDVVPAELEHWFAERRVGTAWRGCSVTAPLKRAAVLHMDSCSSDVVRLGALNLVVKEGPSLKGYNTDLSGLRAALNPHIRSNRRATIIGAGGAAAAALAYSGQRRFKEINLVVRSPKRVLRDLAGRFARQCRLSSFERARGAIEGSGLIINATPLGSRYADAMPPEVLDALEYAAPDAAVLDMVYEPMFTPLLSSAKRAGLTPVSGVEMLIGQARAAFELLFEMPPPSECIAPISRQQTKERQFV